jgi:hypothetical protein
MSALLDAREALKRHDDLTYDHQPLLGIRWHSGWRLAGRCAKEPA